MENERSDRLTREFREQVNDLLAAAQLLAPLVREKGSRRDAECLAVMNKSLYQLMRTISHLELSQEELTFRAQVTDLAGICRELGSQVETLAQELKISFRWELEQENILSLADGPLLERAILNLLTNAFDSAGPGGQVSLRCSSSAGRCTIVVGDNGPGLQVRKPEEDPFLKQPGGVGLGLEAVRRIAQLHDGTLMLENRDGGGLRAVLALPIREPEEGLRMKTSRAQYDRWGGFSPLLVEFSPLLPARSFLPDEIE